MTVNYSAEVLKRATFQDELVNYLADPGAQLRMGTLEYNIVVNFLKRRVREIEDATK